MSHRPIIYTPSGRAGEYAEKGHAVNLFRGCDHGCLYCYAAGMAERFWNLSRSDFHATVKPAPDLLDRIAKDCAAFIAEPIFLCFLCDPYPNNKQARDLTRKAIKIIVESQNSVNILTKGGSRAVRDFDLLSKNHRNKIGATLTFLDADLSAKWEPGAASPIERISMLAEAKRHGIQTWVSLEPVIDPEQSLAVMKSAAPYVDEFKIGRWNHDKQSNEIDWRAFYQQTKMMTDHLGVKTIFKQDLLKAVGVI